MSVLIFNRVNNIFYIYENIVWLQPSQNIENDLINIYL